MANESGSHVELRRDASGRLAMVQTSGSTSNGTHGQVVTTAPSGALDLAGIRRQMAVDEAAKQQAMAECEEELGEKTRNARKALADRRNAAFEKWNAANDKVLSARGVVADHLKELNRLRWWHDTLHDLAGLGIDLAGIAFAANPIVGGVLLVAGAGNAIIKGAGDIAEWDQGSIAPVAQAGAGAFADGVEGAALNLPVAQRPMAGVYGLRGVVLLTDAGELFNLFGDPKLYPFARPESLEAVTKIRDYFASSEKRTWLEKMMGPSRKELDKSFDDLIKAMEKEQELRKLYEAARNAQDGWSGYDMGTCVVKREGQLLHPR